MAIFRREPLKGGRRIPVGEGRNRDSGRIAGYRWIAVNAATASCCQQGAAGQWKVVTLIGGSKRRSLLMAGDDDEMFMTRSLNVTPKTCT